MEYINGVSTQYQLEGDDLHVNRVQDCEPVLDLTSSLRAAGAFGSSEMRHCATIPAVVIEQYCNTHQISFQEWMSNPVHVERMLADPDLKYFRVWGGRV
jgi:hypothetical protein